MGIRKETYIIYGFKFGEEFTNEFFEKDFRDEMEYSEEKDSNEPYFLADGMMGEYTFFGYITQLSKGFNFDEDEIVEIDSCFDCVKLVHTFGKYYKNSVLQTTPKIYYVPHYV